MHLRCPPTWNLYASAGYVLTWLRGTCLGLLGIRRIQGMPCPAATVAMLAAFGVNTLVSATFVR